MGVKWVRESDRYSVKTERSDTNLINGHRSIFGR